MTAQLAAAYGRQVGGDVIGGDKIIVGDMAGSYNAIGAGASVIVNQIQQTLSAVDEMEKSIQAAERRLAEAIRQKLDNTARLAADTGNGRSNPYKALLDYELPDAPFFYGRAAAIVAMQEKMSHNRLTVLYAESGSGKTSLIQAGLASRLLAEGHFPLYIRPYRQSPSQAIRKAFLPDYATQPELRRFCEDRMSLPGFLERATHYLGGQRLYIFLDQFEEFFTELPPVQQQTFAAQLQECLASDLPVWWVLALRKEYFSDLRLFEAARPFDNAYFLPAFSAAEAGEVIIEPAARRGVQYEDGLVDQILLDLSQGTDSIVPVQQQLVCYTLFAERLPGTLPQITRELYRKSRGQGGGGAAGILSSHLTRVLNREMSGQERHTAGRILEALTTSQKRRARKSRTELATELGAVDAGQIDRTLGILRDSRLLRMEPDENDEPVYELAHDYLLAEIELDPAMQGRKLAQEIIRQELAIWQENDCTRIAADKLAMIDPYVPDLCLSDEEQMLVTLSQEAVLQAKQAKEKMRKRQLYLAWATAVVFFIIILILAYNPVRNWYFQHQAKGETQLVSLRDNGRPFFLESHEVSNRQYNYCIRAGICGLPVEPVNYLEDAQGELPVVGITGYQAQTYCRWLDRTLPTATEWAAAYTQAQPRLEEANLWHNTDKDYPLLLPVKGEPTPGMAEASLSHIVGNVQEWTRTFVPGETEGPPLWDDELDSLLCQDGEDCNYRRLQSVGGGVATSGNKSDLTEPGIPLFPFEMSPFDYDNVAGFRCAAAN